MKKLLRIIGVFILVCIIGISLWGWSISEPLPTGKEGEAADALAHKMLKTLNHEAYQNTRFLEWSYQGGKNHYKWDKKLGKCTVSWEDIQVSLNLILPQKSKVFLKGKQLAPSEHEEYIEKAVKNFNNDSFWLVAPYKVFDKGAKRSIVTMDNGSSALLVTYTSGGSTPGDSYLWLLNDNGFPNAYKMWVGIIPIGGIEASWDDWVIAESGAFLPKTHQLGPIELSMGSVRGYN